MLTQSSAFTADYPNGQAPAPLQYTVSSVSRASHFNVIAIEDAAVRGKFPKVVKRVGKSPPQYVDWDEENEEDEEEEE
jgi:hypothetical protein